MGESERRWVDSHVAECPGCRGELGQLRKLHALLQTIPRPAAPDWTGFWPGIVRGIELSRRRAPEAAWRRWLGGRLLPSGLWARPRLALGGAIAVGLLMSVALWQTLLAPSTSAAAVVVDSARSDHPEATVMVYSPAEKDMAVVWVFDVE